MHRCAQHVDSNGLFCRECTLVYDPRRGVCCLLFFPHLLHLLSNTYWNGHEKTSLELRGSSGQNIVVITLTSHMRPLLTRSIFIITLEVEWDLPIWRIYKNFMLLVSKNKKNKWNRLCTEKILSIIRSWNSQHDFVTNLSDSK